MSELWIYQMFKVKVQTLGCWDGTQQVRKPLFLFLTLIDTMCLHTSLMYFTSCPSTATPFLHLVMCCVCLQEFFLACCGIPEEDSDFMSHFKDTEIHSPVFSLQGEEEEIRAGRAAFNSSEGDNIKNNQGWSSIF